MTSVKKTKVTLFLQFNLLQIHVNHTKLFLIINANKLSVDNSIDRLLFHIYLENINF